MKMISAVIRPSEIDDLRDALAGFGISGNTVSKVRAFGRQRGDAELYRAAEYQVDFVPKIQINIAVTTADSDKALETLCQAAATDATGDGEIVFTSPDHAVRVRTGAVDGGALLSKMRR